MTNHETFPWAQVTSQERTSTALRLGPESPRSGEVGGGLWIGQEMVFFLVLDRQRPSDHMLLRFENRVH